ncbi:MAG: hypothetical protein KDK70_20300 [Myxococcales bacterium]|nr:hypothetical protein [Myxococcales bacterium]
MRRSPTPVLALFALIACQAKIGDECVRSTDCSIRGERVCDLSHRVNDQGVITPAGQGECTIDGCGRDSCPKEAACIKAYGSNFLSVACDPEREDLATFCDLEQDGEDACTARGCSPSVEAGVWTCPPRNDCDANEVCLPEGLCADEITARTSCRRKCSSNRDCRSGYECLLTGSEGIYRAPDVDDPDNPSNVRICMPVR